MVNVLRCQGLVESQLALEATVRIADFRLIARQGRLTVRKHEGAELTVLLALVGFGSGLLSQFDCRLAFELRVAQPTVRCEHAEDY